MTFHFSSLTPSSSLRYACQATRPASTLHSPFSRFPCARGSPTVRRLMIETDFELLKGIANQLRIHSTPPTPAAGSGHPTSCCSAADVVACLFFGHMRFDPKNPHYHN